MFIFCLRRPADLKLFKDIIAKDAKLEKLVEPLSQEYKVATATGVYSNDPEHRKLDAELFHFEMDPEFEGSEADAAKEIKTFLPRLAELLKFIDTNTMKIYFKSICDKGSALPLIDDGPELKNTSTLDEDDLPLPFGGALPRHKAYDKKNLPPMSQMKRANRHDDEIDGGLPPMSSYPKLERKPKVILSDDDKIDGGLPPMSSLPKLERKPKVILGTN